MRSCLILLVVGIVLSASCGGKEHSTAQLIAVDPLVAETLTGSLPELPEDVPLPLLKATAAVNAVLPGDSFEASSEGVISSPGQAEYVSPPEGLCWAIYHFSGAPDEAISALTANASGLAADERMYLAIADYQSERWFILPGQNVSGITNSLDSTPGRWQTESGSTYVAVIAYGGDSFVLESIELTYADRFTITGQVHDHAEQPIPGVLVTAMFGALSDTTDSGGNFVLAGLPSGSWPVVATKSGWTFYDQPALIEIDAADAIATIIGNQNGENFVPSETVEGNNDLNGQPWDFGAGPLTESLGALDDTRDSYSFEITAAGNYSLVFRNLSESMYFNLIVLRALGSNSTVVFGPSVLHGDQTIGFSVFEAPAEFIVDLRCFGGGGEYSLTLVESPSYLVGGTIENGSGAPIRSCVVDVENTDLDLHSTYYGSQSTEETYIDLARLGGNTVITPQADGHSFVPASRTILIEQDELNLDFVATEELPDALEPNDDFAGAQPLGALPYSAQHEFSVGADDPKDYYSIAPPAGKALRIRADVELFEASNFLGLTVYDESENHVALSDRGQTGTYIIPNFLTDGGIYYVEARLEDGQRLGYTLEIEAYDPVVLQLGVRVGGILVASEARFFVHDEHFDHMMELDTSDASGLTQAIYFPAGEIVNIECDRFGIPADGLTRRFTVPASATQLLFESPDWGADEHEPNNGSTALPQMTAPFTVNATADLFTDAREHYRIVNPQFGTYSLVFNGSPDSGGISVSVLNSQGEEFYSKDSVKNGEKIYFRASGGSFIDLHLLVLSSDCNYSLTVELAPAFRVFGTVEGDPGDTLFDRNVIVAQTGERISTEIDGSYQTELLGPGQYRIICFNVGYDPTYVDQTIEIVDDDVEVNFSGLVPLVQDNYEPNNSDATAHIIELDTKYNASCRTGIDSLDFYRIEGLQVDDQLHIAIECEDVSDLRAKLYMRNDGFEVKDFYRNSKGVLILDHLVGTEQDYLIRVTGEANYEFVAQLIP